MEGSCALRQGNAACGLTGSDADTLNVEHDLSRWLRDLDTSMSTKTASPRKPAPPKVASKPCTSPGINSPPQQPTGSKHDVDADFEAILGQLNSLDQLFDSVSTGPPSSAASTTGPTAPRPAGHMQAVSTAPTSEFDGCDEVLRGALLELNTIANSPAANCVSRADVPPTSPRQNGHVDRRRRPCDDPPSSSSSSSLSTVASDKSSTRNGSSPPASSSLSPSLSIKPAQTPVQVFLPDGASSHVMVDEQMSGDQLCRLMMKKRNVPLMTSWSILEQLPDLLMERRIEQHEVVLDVVRNWVKGSSNRLVFVENVGRYALYDSDHQGLLVDSVYGVHGPLHIKAEDKKTWKKVDCVLRATGLCCATTPPGGSGGKQGRQTDVTCLQSLGEVDIYLGVDWRKKYKSQTEHGIALKPAYVQKKTPKCTKYLCCDDEASLVRWLTALRLAKYGDHLAKVSRGPELSRDQTVASSPVHPPGSSSAAAVCSPCVDVSSTTSSSTDELAGTSTIRRKGSLIPALPITTQTTRFLSQQSRSGMDDVEGSQRAETLHGNRLSELPCPPPSASVTTAVDPRIPTPPSSHPTNNDTPRHGGRAPPVAEHRPPTATAATSPRDLPSPPTSANTTAADARFIIPTTLSNLSTDNGANWPANRAPATTGHRQPPTTHATPTRTASARSADGAVNGSPARSKPAPPKRSETTKLSTPDPRQTKAFIMNLDRVISQKNCKGSGGLGSLPVPLPPRPVYVDGPTYLDTDDLPPPPAELLEGLRSYRRQDVPLPPIPAPGRR